MGVIYVFMRRESMTANYVANMARTVASLYGGSPDTQPTQKGNP